MRFHPSSPVQPNPKKNLEKSQKIPLVLPIEEISLQPELSSPASFGFQGGTGA